ncbi:hypothetical protein, conserved [Eimeria tenella]|uniref:Uncharacterized protein n=1 Tax=Eimeria tenella TaxID=5802 RepID=U6L1M4_EIMTE|nr:hypothetical protein, conserved [Eimeria tenella]CDJ41670.1 hypothetical protein, conserved [Eimeria tenella]|eukprot:XP_013232420.1 hypothetical protein, conserved [Eimeria tenella]
MQRRSFSCLSLFPSFLIFSLFYFILFLFLFAGASLSPASPLSPKLRGPVEFPAAAAAAAAAGLGPAPAAAAAPEDGDAARLWEAAAAVPGAAEGGAAAHASPPGSPGSPAAAAAAAAAAGGPESLPWFERVSLSCSEPNPEFERMSQVCLSEAPAAAAAAAAAAGVGPHSVPVGEFQRMCLLAAEHLGCLYRRLAVDYLLLAPLSPEELAAAVAEGLSEILEEEDSVADLVISKRLPHGALPVHSLKQAVLNKLQKLHKIRKRNAHMTLHYCMQSPTLQQQQQMAQLLLPLLNAHRSRLRLSAEKGIPILAPDEHILIWFFMEIFARENKLVGKERPLNLWRFPEPAGALNILD